MASIRPIKGRWQVQIRRDARWFPLPFALRFELCPVINHERLISLGLPHFRVTLLRPLLELATAASEGIVTAQVCENQNLAVALGINLLCNSAQASIEATRIVTSRMKACSWEESPCCCSSSGARAAHRGEDSASG